MKLDICMRFNARAWCSCWQLGLRVVDISITATQLQLTTTFLLGKSLKLFKFFLKYCTLNAVQFLIEMLKKDLETFFEVDFFTCQDFYKRISGIVFGTLDVKREACVAT